MMHGWEHGLSARVPAKAYGQGVRMGRQCSPPRACAKLHATATPLSPLRANHAHQHLPNASTTTSPCSHPCLHAHSKDTRASHKTLSEVNLYEKSRHPKPLEVNPHSPRPPPHTLHAPPRALPPHTPARPHTLTPHAPAHSPRTLTPHAPAHSPRTPPRTHPARPRTPPHAHPAHPRTLTPRTPARPRALTPARPRTPPARALPAHPRAPTPLAHAKPHPMLCAINVLPTAYQKCWMLPP